MKHDVQEQELHDRLCNAACLSIIFIIAGTVINACQSPDPEKVKAQQEERLTQAQAAFRQNGFSIVGAMYRDNTGNRYVQDCYTLQKQPDNGERYQACISYELRGNRISEIRSI